jgi:hypothetical protein
MMSRRTLAIGTVLVLAVAACSSDEATPISGDRSGAEPVPTGSSLPTPSTVSPEPSTIPETSVVPETPVTEPTTAAPEPTLAPETTVVEPTRVWSVTQADAELPNAPDNFMQELNVMVLPDGRPRVIYGSGTSLRMATCVDLTCTEVEVVEVLDTAPAMAGGVSAAVRGDGSPVIVADQLMVWCEDPECDSVTTSVLPEFRYREPWLVTSPDGRVGVFDVVATEPSVGPVDRFVGFTYCEDAGCLDDPDGLTELRYVSADEFVFHGIGVGGFDADGLPLAVHWAPTRSGETELMVVACRDVDCVSVDEPHAVAEGDEFVFRLRSPMATQGGGLVLLYEHGYGRTGDISVTVCEDIACSDAVSAGLHHLEGGANTPFSGALGPDGMLRAVSTTTEGFELTTCDDPACSAFVTSELVPHRAHQIGLVIAGDGATVVATADFCPPDEPNIYPGVWFLRCEDRSCDPPEAGS